jgi:hypothetical protein
VVDLAGFTEEFTEVIPQGEQLTHDVTLGGAECSQGNTPHGSLSLTLRGVCAVPRSCPLGDTLGVAWLRKPAGVALAVALLTTRGELRLLLVGEVFGRVRQPPPADRTRLADGGYCTATTTTGWPLSSVSSRHQWGRAVRRTLARVLRVKRVQSPVNKVTASTWTIRRLVPAFAV